MPDIVYGGPYADESAAITKESQKENPNFAELTKDWKTISQGAVNYIEQVQKPIEKPVGTFISNVQEEEKEVEIPAVVPFTAPDEVASDPDATVSTAPEETSEEEQSQEEFDKELGL